jgi:hypothetical protein
MKLLKKILAFSEKPASNIIGGSMKRKKVWGSKDKILNKLLH